jgi:ABC-type ATPase involved in cell division
MDKSELESNAISYLKANLEKLFSMYLNGHNQLDEKLAFFTAGPSGAGKTEFVQEILNIESDLVHLDIDEIRNFFTDIGYGLDN